MIETPAQTATPRQRAQAMLKAAKKASLFGQRSAARDFPRREYAVAEEPVASVRAQGRTGLPQSDRGLVIEDPTRELHPYLARGFGDDLGVYERMWRSDPVIAGTVDMIAREVSRAHLKIEGPVRPTRAETRAVELAKRFLALDDTLGWMRGGIRTHLRESLRRRLQYGHCPFEVLWDEQTWQRSTILVPGRCLYRAPSATWGWLWGRDTLEGLIQSVKSSAPQSLTTRSLLGRKTATIPAHRLLLYVHNGTPDVNPEGVSMLRPAWIWWRSKRDVMLRHHEASERLFGGVTVLEEVAHPKTGNAYPENSETDLDEFETLMDQWADHLLSFFFQPLGYKIRQDHPEFEIKSPRDLLEYFDQQIRLVFVAQLLGQGGSASLSASSGQLLYNAIDGLASDHLEVFNGQYGVPTSGIISRFICANIPEALTDPTFRFPRLTASGIPFQDIKAFIDAASKASQFRLLSYSAETEAQLRQMLNLPRLDPEQYELRQEWERARLEGEISGASGEVMGETDQERESEEGTQAPIEPPEQTPDTDPDGV